MKLSGLHILLTYQCTRACEHCFVWGSPRQRGVFDVEQIEQVLDQAKEAGVEWVYFEGGEPFIYYDVLVRGVRRAKEMGFTVGIVSNAYWAASVATAAEHLQPFKGLLSDLTVSSDLYHAGQELSEESQNAIVAAKVAGYSNRHDQHCQNRRRSSSDAWSDQGPRRSHVSWQGAVALASHTDGHLWSEFTRCPHEDLRVPGVPILTRLEICTSARES